jgi:hypothetical protein
MMLIEQSSGRRLKGKRPESEGENHERDSNKQDAEGTKWTSYPWRHHGLM